MQYPYPITIWWFLVPVLAVTAFVFCTRYFIRVFHPRTRVQRTLVLTGASLVGLYLAYRFAFHQYQFSDDWRIVGLPMPAVPLERTFYPDGRVFWKDWIGLQMPFGFLCNIAFWLLAPFVPLALWVWLHRHLTKRWRQAMTSGK